MKHLVHSLKTLSLPFEVNDDWAIVIQMGALTAVAASLAKLQEIHVVHIDNWFGARWLGFQGKILGIAGLRTNWTAKAPKYSIPPFHPHRILGEYRYEFDADGYISGPTTPSSCLHSRRSSEENIRQSFEKVCTPGTYAWYSGRTTSNDRASLMVYTHTHDGTSAWYAEFRKDKNWRLSRRIGVGNKEWRDLMRQAACHHLGETVNRFEI